jgi:hypothetical protein
MSNPTNPSRGKPAAAAFNAMPPPQSNLTGNHPNSRNLPNRGRSASRTRTTLPHVPKMPKEPRLPAMNFVAGVQQPHSDAELAAHVLVLEEFNKEMAVYNEAVEAFEQATRPQHQSRGQKRSHYVQGPNGNPIFNHLNDQQNRERARSYDSQFLNQPLVLQTSNLAPEANSLALEPNNLAIEPNTLALPAVTLLGDEFLNAINTSNNLDQLSMIRTLG